MKPQDFMEALGGVSQEKLDALAKWQEAGTPITGKAPVREKHITQTASEPVPAIRRRGTMKKKAKSTPVIRLFPWNIGIGAAVVACAVIAVSIGKEVIGQEKQMQVGSNVGISITEQISEREPIEITDYRIEGFDVVMDVPETGTAQLLHTVEDAISWINFVHQSGEYGRKTGNSAEDFRTLLEDGGIYQDYDLIITAVPYHFVYQDHGVAMYGFDGGTVTPGGSLTVEMRFLTVGNAMPERILQQIDTFCCCFAVPKNTVPEITAFTFHDVIYDCTAPLPDGCDTREAHLDYLYSMPNYQEFMDKDRAAKYLRWAEDEIQTADAIHEPVEIIDKLIVSGGNDSTMMKLPPEGAVQVLRSVEDAEACCQYSDENVAGQPFDFRNKLTEDVFAEYDVLYFAFKDGQKPQYCYSVDLAGGSIAADGSTLKLDFHALIFDPAHLPSDWCSVTEPDWNTYYFYTVPKNTLPDLNAIELSFEEYPLGEIPDEILANPHENVGVTDDGKTIMALQKYLETTKEYLNWLNSVPNPKYITWETGTATDDQFYAWYWTSYHGNDIELDGKTVTLIRTAEEGSPYLTHSGQQNETDLETMLSADWLENGGTFFIDPVNHSHISNTGEPHDVIFIGVPASEMPENMIGWDYHCGTVTPSGKLHLDFSVMTLSDEAIAAINKQYDADTNFYYFISVPEGAMPDLTGWELSFTEHHSDAMPDDDVIENPDEIGLDGQTRLTAWRQTLPEYQEHMSSVVGSKYITWEDDALVPPENCTEVQEISGDTDS